MNALLSPVLTALQTAPAAIPYGHAGMTLIVLCALTVILMTRAALAR